MVATNCADSYAMGAFAIAGHAGALLEWHGTSKFCRHCGSPTASIDAGRRKQCTNECCKKKIYPRVDPVVSSSMDLSCRLHRGIGPIFNQRPGESLEEAVRRETLEETGIEVGEVVYHSSQPWPGLF